MAGLALNFGLKNEQNSNILVHLCNVEMLNIPCVDVGGKKNSDCSCLMAGCEISAVEPSRELIYKGTVEICMMTFRALSQVRAAHVV